MVLVIGQVWLVVQVEEVQVILHLLEEMEIHQVPLHHKEILVEMVIILLQYQQVEVEEVVLRLDLMLVVAELLLVEQVQHLQ